MKKETTLNISLLPLVVLILLILGAGYFLLQDEIKLPKFNKGPQIRRLEGFPTLVYTDKEMEKQRKIIKSEAELNEFLNAVDDSGLLVLKESINFDREYLLAVSSSTNEETGHEIKIKRAYEDKESKKLLVTVEEVEKDEECPLEKDKNVTVDIVAVSKTDLEIEFDRVKKIEECKQEE